MTTSLRKGNRKNPAIVLLQAILVPLISVAPIAALLIYALGLDPSEQLTRGILYACLFLVSFFTGWKMFGLAGIGLTGKNIGRGFLYAGIILAIGLTFIFILQPIEGLADISYAIWSPILFYLTVAIAEETWFRGLIFQALQTWKGALFSVFGSAILFGLIHVPTHGWEGLLYSLSIGLPYAIVRLKSGNIWGLIVVHWVTNLTDTFMYLHTTSLYIIWITLLHVLVFTGVSIFILFIDRRFRHKE